MPDGVWAVVVARVTRGAKSRLAPVLDISQRQSLALSMLSDVLCVCARSTDGVVAVVDDASARLTAQSYGAVVVDDPRTGDMNAAARLGIAAAREHGAGIVIVLPGDVPLISPRDLERLVASANVERAVIIGASRDGQGTNALLLRPPDVIDPSFGPPSVDRHVRLGVAAGAVAQVLTDLDLALDIDTPADLAALAQSAGRAG